MEIKIKTCDERLEELNEELDLLFEKHEEQVNMIMSKIEIIYRLKASQATPAERNM